MTTSSSTAMLGRRSLPRDVSELTESYGAVLAGILKDAKQRGKSVEDLAQELFIRGVLWTFPLEDFLPPILSMSQVLDLLGAEWPQWSRWQYNASKGHGRHSELAPKPVIGNTYSKNSEYATKDILQVFRSGKKWSDAAPLYPEETVRAYTEFVKAAAERVIYDWTHQPKPRKTMSDTKTTSSTVQAKKPAGEKSVVGWPIGVPKNYDSMYREYSGFVQRTLLTYLKPCPSQQIEDVEQHIWMKIIESKMIEKFVAKARYRKLPKRLTAAEAVEYLGITWDQWLDLMRKDLAWLQAAEGTNFSNSAVFTAEQIRNVEESGLFPIRDEIPAEDMTKVFRGYLRNAIHNHFANYCRTRVRRFVKDLVVPAENSRVIGGKIGSALEGDNTAWEDSLEDRDGSRPDDCCDLPEASSVEELNSNLTEQIVRINRLVPSNRHEQVFNLISEGCSIREAIARVRATVTAEMHQAVAVVV